MTWHLEGAFVVLMYLKKLWTSPLQGTPYQTSQTSLLLSLQTCMNSWDVVYPTL